MNQTKDFRLKLAAPDTFVKCMNILGALLDRVDLSISANSLTLNAMDPSHVCQVDLVLPRDFFNECKADKRQTIQIDLKELNMVLKRGRNEVLFLIAEAGDNKMLVQMQGDSKRTFKINLYPPGESPVPEREISFDAKFGLSADDLANLVGDASLASDYMTLSLIPDIVGDYLELDTGVTEDGMEFSAVVTKFVEKPVALKKQTAVYSLEYLKDIVKSQTIASNCRLQFSSEMPLKLEYILEHQATLVFTLAPRIEEKEDEDTPARPPTEKDASEEYHDHIGETYKKNQPSKRAVKKSKAIDEFEYRDKEPEEESEAEQG